MNKEQALQVIEQALNISAQKGVFGLEDAATIFAALNELKRFDDPQDNPNKETIQSLNSDNN